MIVNQIIQFIANKFLQMSKNKNIWNILTCSLTNFCPVLYSYIGSYARLQFFLICHNLGYIGAKYLHYKSKWHWNHNNLHPKQCNRSHILTFWKCVYIRRGRLRVKFWPVFNVTFMHSVLLSALLPVYRFLFIKTMKSIDLLTPQVANSWALNSW